MKIWLITTYSTDFDLNFIPHHFTHYTNLGISPENFLVVIHNRIYLDRLRWAVDYLSNRGIFFEIWTEEYNTIQKMELSYKHMQKFCKEDDWILHAEADEFHQYSKPFSSLIEDCKEKDYGGVYGVFIDRIALNGELAEISTDKPLGEQFPIRCFSNKIWNANPLLKTNFKVMLYRADLVPNSGIHSLQNDVEYHPEIQKVHHFRWNSTTREKYERRAKFVNNAWNSHKIIKYLNLNNNKVNLCDVTILDNNSFLQHLF